MTYKKYFGKFIGSKKIKNIVLLDEKTYLGKNKVKVEFDDETSYIYPEEALEDIVTQDKKDATELRDLRVNPVIEKVLTILVESELTLPEIDYAMGPKLRGSIDDARERANKILLGKENYQVNLMDIEKILRMENKTMKKKYENKTNSKENKD